MHAYYILFVNCFPQGMLSLLGLELLALLYLTSCGYVFVICVCPS